MINNAQQLMTNSEYMALPTYQEAERRPELVRELIHHFHTLSATRSSGLHWWVGARGDDGDRVYGARYYCADKLDWNSPSDHYGAETAHYTHGNFVPWTPFSLAELAKSNALCKEQRWVGMVHQIFDAIRADDRAIRQEYQTMRRRDAWGSLYWIISKLHSTKVKRATPRVQQIK